MILRPGPVIYASRILCSRTLLVTDSINLDFDADGHLIGIELLDPALLHPNLMAQAEKPGHG